MTGKIEVDEQALHEAYRDVFTSHSGRIVLADLVRFYGFTKRSTFTPGDPYRTAYNEGSRSVIVFIEKRLTEEPAGNKTQPVFDGAPLASEEGDGYDTGSYGD